jgi:hypothetical protein
MFAKTLLADDRLEQRLLLIGAMAIATSMKDVA